MNAAPLERVGSYVTVGQVYLNGKGPYRFLVDTGAQSCALTPQAALEAGLMPRYRVEQVTVAGSRLVPAGEARTVEVGGAVEKDVEVLIHDLRAVRSVHPDVVGVLGQSFLARRSYLLDLESGRIAFGVPPEAVDGKRVPFRLQDGRLLVEAAVDGERRSLILDSGAPSLVLFGSRARGGPPGRVATDAGSLGAVLSRRTVAVGGTRRQVQAAEVAEGDHGAGLLPVWIFARVYVSARHIIFDPGLRPSGRPE
jgi:predicted aspartyl protease